MRCCTLLWVWRRVVGFNTFISCLVTATLESLPRWVFHLGEVGIGIFISAVTFTRLHRGASSSAKISGKPLMLPAEHTKS